MNGPGAEKYLFFDALAVRGTNLGLHVSVSSSLSPKNHRNCERRRHSFLTLGPAHSKVSTAETFFSEEKRDPRESATVTHENFKELDEDDTVTDGGNPKNARGGISVVNVR